MTSGNSTSPARLDLVTWRTERGLICAQLCHTLPLFAIRCHTLPHFATLPRNCSRSTCLQSKVKRISVKAHKKALKAVKGLYLVELCPSSAAETYGVTCSVQCSQCSRRRAVRGITFHYGSCSALILRTTIMRCAHNQQIALRPPITYSNHANERLLIRRVGLRAAPARFAPDRVPGNAEVMFNVQRSS